MPTINATPKDPQANCYVTLAMANEYFDEHPLYANWTGTDDEKKRALIFATRIIDSFRFHSSPISVEQKLKFPRSGSSDAYDSEVDSKSNLVITDSNLAQPDTWPADFWKYAGLEILSGDAKYENKLIVAYNFKTGQITLESDFTGSVVAGDNYEITQQIPDKIRWACCEIAYAFINSDDPMDFDPRVTQYSIGDLSETFGKTGEGTFILPAKVWAFLKPYIKNTLNCKY